MRAHMAFPCSNVHTVGRWDWLNGGLLDSRNSRNYTLMAFEDVHGFAPSRSARCFAKCFRDDASLRCEDVLGGVELPGEAFIAFNERTCVEQAQ